MNVKLRKYGEEYLILNNIKTWPKEWVNYINDNIEIIQKYFSELENIISNLLYIPKYYNLFEDIKNGFKEIILNSNCELICFHATRLVNHEVEKIKQSGLTISTEDFIIKKIDLLAEKSLINVEETEILKKYNLLNYSCSRQSRENRLYFTCGEQKINFDKENNSELYFLYKNYGGEIIYRGLLKKEEDLQKKLNQISEPYLIICSIKISNIKNEISVWIDDLIKFYLKKGNSIMSKDFSINSNCSKILDLIEVDENSKLDYT